MKVAHFVVITPGRSGLYETTRELVTELRRQGVDSRMFDPTKEKNALYPGGDEDRGALFANEEWVKDADVFVSHSGLGSFGGDQPVISVAHGRPRHSFLNENAGGPAVYTYHHSKNKDPRFKTIVTFWPQHVEYLKFIYPDKEVTLIPPCVDLDRWSPGESDYDFAGQAGKINVVIADGWKNDIDPFNSVNAFGMWARENKGAKLHIFGETKLKALKPLISRLQQDGTMGVWQGWAQALEYVYRKADFLLTPNEIDTRTVREAMACGCPVFRTQDDISMTTFDPMDRESVRKKAELMFHPINTGKQFKRVLTSLT